MKTRYLLLLLPVLFLCCKKKHKNIPDPTVNNDPFSYAITFDTVVSCPAHTSYNFSFYIKVLTGSISDNKLTCTVEGLPSTIAVSPPSMVVTNLLGGVFIFYIEDIANGSYPFRVKVNGVKSGEQVYNAVLKIVPPLDYAPFLAGTYDSSFDFCPATGIAFYTTQVSTVADTPYLVKISNVKNLGSSFVVRALVSKTVTIPIQSVGGITIWGSGTYNHDGRPGHENDFVTTVKDTIVTGVDTETCTMHIQH